LALAALALVIFGAYDSYPVIFEDESATPRCVVSVSNVGLSIFRDLAERSRASHVNLS